MSCALARGGVRDPGQRRPLQAGAFLQDGLAQFMEAELATGVPSTPVGEQWRISKKEGFVTAGLALRLEGELVEVLALDPVEGPNPNPNPNRGARPGPSGGDDTARGG